MTHERRSSVDALRLDLIRLEDTHAARRWTLVDAISGRIWRLTRHDCERLQQPQFAKDHDADQDDLLLKQATAAGLLRQRTATPWHWWTVPLRALAFRIPLGSVDPLATWLAKHSALLFSPLAVIGWTVIACLALLSVLVGWSRAQDSFAMLASAAGSATAIGYWMGALFVLTRCLHELGHATVCRRTGVPVGDVGVFFFCGIPCPYCDVSQVWRNDSPVQRAAVMLAGIYVEVVLASVATLIWWLTTSGPVHLLAMNLMLVSGVSAVVFNANPLMRLDGYYVLSDCLGTPHLRRQAELAWQAVVRCRVSGIADGRAEANVTSCGLAIYHALSTGYRWLVAVIVLTFVMTLLNEWNLWWIGMTMISAWGCLLTYHVFRRWMNVLLGRGSWSQSPLVRRLAISFAALVTIMACLSVPVRREVKAFGVLDVAEAVDVFVPESAWVDRVSREYGDRVEAGEALATLRDDQLTIQLAAWKSRSALAKLESEHLKREVLQQVDGDVAWKLDRANRDLVESQHASLVSRLDRLIITAPRDGVILPALNGEQTHAGPAVLGDRRGAFVAGRTTWCRVGDPAQTCAVIGVTAQQRQQLEPGNSATIVLDDGRIRSVVTKIDTIDEIPPQLRPLHNDAAYIIRCRMPPALFENSTFVPIGAAVEARMCFEQETVWRWLRRLTSEMLHG